MFNQIPTNGLTFSKVLGGVSKTLSIANQVIPLYQQAKPMISNAKNILGVLREFNSKKTHLNSSESNNKPTQESKYAKKTAEPTNSPVFFQ